MLLGQKCNIFSTFSEPPSVHMWIYTDHVNSVRKSLFITIIYKYSVICIIKLRFISLHFIFRLGFHRLPVLLKMVRYFPKKCSCVTCLYEIVRSHLRKIVNNTVCVWCRLVSIIYSETYRKIAYFRGGFICEKWGFRTMFHHQGNTHTNAQRRYTSGELHWLLSPVVAQE